MKTTATLGLIGYGAFGKLIFPFLNSDFDVRIYDPAPHFSANEKYSTLENAAKCDLVVIATPVQVIEDVAVAIAPLIRPGALVLDVGSVKILPAQILMETLPTYVDIICTHPLFGPQSAKNGLDGLKIVLCPLRGKRLPAVRHWLEKKSLRVVSTTPDQHDREMALAQGVTHLIAKVIVSLCPDGPQLSTPSFDLLLAATEMVRYDAPEVFRAIESNNPHSANIRRRFFELADEIRASFS